MGAYKTRALVELKDLETADKTISEIEAELNRKIEEKTELVKSIAELETTIEKERENTSTSVINLEMFVFT